MMTTPPEIHAQLQTLAIPKDQRPAARSNSRASRGVIVFVLLLVVLGIGAYAARDTIGAKLSMVTREGPAPEWKFLRVVRQAQPDPPPVLTATGKIVSDHHVRVATKVSGQIVSLHFEQGDKVEEGQILARVEDVLYRARRDQAAAELEKSKSNLQYQTVNYERVSRLSEGAQAAGIEFADAKRWILDAQAQVAANEALLDFAQKYLADCEVAAPIAGVILERNVEVGDFVAAEGGRGAMANAQFGTIADMTALRVEVDISELDIARIRKDMPCVITPDANKNRRYNGHVMWLDPGANYSKATVQVKVRINDPDTELRVEGSAQVAFLAQPTAPKEGRQAGLWIPKSACRFDASRATATVFVVVDGTARQRTVTLGGDSGDQVEVLAGLEEGQTVVVDGPENLKDGQRVKI